MSALLLPPSVLQQPKPNQCRLAWVWPVSNVAPQATASRPSIAPSQDVASLTFSNRASVIALGSQPFQLQITPPVELLRRRTAKLTASVPSDRPPFISLAQGDTSLYCPATPRQPRSEACLSQEMKDLVLRFLTWLPATALLVPSIIVLATAFAKIASAKRRLTEEDFAIGLDLLFTAVGSQLAALAAGSKLNRAEVYVVADLDVGFALLLGLLWLVVAMAIWVRARGWDEFDRLKIRQGLAYPIVVGFISLGLVYSLNVRLLAS